MPEELCGSSSTLSSLQKYTQVDHSLHQHRNHLLDRQSSQAQNFRDIPVLGGQQIDREFVSFSSESVFSASPHHHEPDTQFSDVQFINWVADFQERQLHATLPIFSSDDDVQQTAWGTEFQSRYPGTRSQVVGPNFRVQQPFSYLYPVGLNMNLNVPLPNQLEFEQAFEDAFDEATLELDHMRVAINDSPRNEIKAETEPHDILVKREQLVPIGPDELALTAGKLLDSVGSDCSQKFQNSNFLALMRRLRDKEVIIDGDSMVET